MIKHYWAIVLGMLGILAVPVMASIPIQIMDVASGQVFYFTDAGIVANLPGMNGILSLSLTASVGTPSIGAVLVDGKAVRTGDYVSSRPQFSVSIAPATGGDIASYLLQIINSDSVAVLESTANILGTAVTASVDLVFQPTAALSSGGQYFVRVNAKDSNGRSVTENSNTFKLDEKFRLMNAMNGPNPFNPAKESTYIEYQLTQDAEVKLYIYSISGEQLWQRTISSTAGYTSIPWDGRNTFGEWVPNGVYIAYIVGKSGSDRTTAKVKMAVLK